VLRRLGVGHHVLAGGGGLAAELIQTHHKARSLARHRVVLVWAEVVLLVYGDPVAHGSQAQAPPVLGMLPGGLLYLGEELLRNVLALVGLDQALAL